MSLKQTNKQREKREREKKIKINFAYEKRTHRNHSVRLCFIQDDTIRAATKHANTDSPYYNQLLFEMHVTSQRH